MNDGTIGLDEAAPDGVGTTPQHSPGTSSATALAHNPAGKERTLKRLRRIEGQARGLQKMVDEEQYCIDILTQVSAMTSALQSVALGLLEDHLGHCVREAIAEGGDAAEAKITEASAAIARLVRA